MPGWATAPGARLPGVGGRRSRARVTGRGHRDRAPRGGAGAGRGSVGHEPLLRVLETGGEHRGLSTELGAPRLAGPGRGPCALLSGTGWAHGGPSTALPGRGRGRGRGGWGPSGEHFCSTRPGAEPVLPAPRPASWKGEHPEGPPSPERSHRVAAGTAPRRPEGHLLTCGTWRGAGLLQVPPRAPWHTHPASGFSVPTRPCFCPFDDGEIEKGRGGKEEGDACSLPHPW